MKGGARIQGLHFAFPGAAHPVLHDVHFHVPAGTTTAVLGPSGAGKSTLLRLIAGLLPCAGHQVVLPEWAAGEVPVAMVFQDPRLLPWLTVRENLEFALEASGVPAGQRRDRFAPLLEAVGMADTEALRPAELSGGMAQRVGVVRALALRPRLLLLDEPFGAVDPLRRDALQTTLVALLQERATTAILVTHDVREAAVLADDVVILGGNPATVVARQHLALAKPRDSLSAEVAAIARGIRARLDVPE